MNTPLEELSVDILRDFVNKEEWEAIIQLTEVNSQYEHCDWVKFFRAYSFDKLNKLELSLKEVYLGLKIDQDNHWGQTLLFNVLLRLGQVDEAFIKMRTHLLKFNDESNIDSIRSHFVLCAVNHNRFDLAIEINETRNVIRKTVMSARYAVALQCFNKSDTLEKVFENLCNCHDAKNFGLVILQDSAKNSVKILEYISDVNKTKNVLHKWLPKLVEVFESVQIIENQENLGTAPTCRKLLDFVSNHYDGFIFIEDDCLLANDALQWALYQLDNNISVEKFWFSTCESIFFNGGKNNPPENIAHVTELYSKLYNVRASYFLIDFVPSTCFITRSDIWKNCSKYRSLTQGPESLTKYVLLLGKKTISPVVPRASDIGMLHDLGYSVSVLGKENVKEYKNTYIMSSGNLDVENIMLYAGDERALYSVSVNFIYKSLEQLCADSKL